MPSGLMMRRIVLPQAVALMLPPFGNSSLQLLKSTAACSLIAIHELVFRGRIVVENTGRAFDTFVVLFLIFLVITLPMVLVLVRMERRAGRGLDIGRPV
jgi:polar amino acid transport system permease protein